MHAVDEIGFAVATRRKYYGHVTWCGPDTSSGLTDNWTASTNECTGDGGPTAAPNVRERGSLTTRRTLRVFWNVARHVDKHVFVSGPAGGPMNWGRLRVRNVRKIMEYIRVAATVAVITGRLSRWLSQLLEPTVEVR